MRMHRTFSFDIESEHLHGEGFAFGAVVLDCHGQVLDEYAARAEAPGSCDWVKANVWPHIQDIRLVANARAVRDEFWRFYIGHRILATVADQRFVVLADCAWPVEARFLSACVDDDPDRANVAPCPLHDLTSFLLAAGHANPFDADRAAYASDLLAAAGRPVGKKHDPRWDALVAGLCAVRLLDEIGADRVRRVPQ